MQSNNVNIANISEKKFTKFLYKKEYLLGESLNK